MWKPRNKWQLQTKGGCDSNGGGSSSDSRIVIRGTKNQDGTFEFESIAPDLDGDRLLLADVIVKEAANPNTFERNYVDRIVTGGLIYTLNTYSFGPLSYDPLTGAVSMSGGSK